MLLVCQFLLSGCFTMERKTVVVGGQVFEDVVVTKKKLLLASDDNINVSNMCPPGYFVDVRRGSKILVEGIKPLQTMTIRPSSNYRNEPVSFSLMVYKRSGGGEKELVYFRDEIIRVGSAPITANWVANKDYANLNIQQQYYGY